MAQDEVAETAGSCGHGGGDPACKCWGVICNEHTWMALSCVTDRATNYVAAYDEALQYRRVAMGATSSFRVRRVSHMMTSTPCKDCGAVKCDCAAPIWDYTFRSTQYPSGVWRGGNPLHIRPAIGCPRQYIAELHASGKAEGVERGHIQRITDPPYARYDAITHTWRVDPPRAGEHVGTRANDPVAECGHKLDDESCRCWGVHMAPSVGGSEWVWAGSGFGGALQCHWAHADQTRSRLGAAHKDVCYTVRRYGTLVRTAPATLKCDLEWCETQTAKGFCSHRCIDYAVRQRVIVLRLTDFEKRTEAKRGGRLWSELKWAREKTGHELLELQRSWRAVQHENAVGDERYFKLLGDDE